MPPSCNVCWMLFRRTAISTSTKAATSTRPEYLADHAGAYWLLDLIFARQRKAKKDARFRNVQRWELDVENQTLTCHGENASFTLYPTILDFPLQTVTLLLDDDTLMLPSEH